MTSNAIAVQNGHESIDIAVVEKVITGGDLGQLTPEQRVRYYIQTCESLKLNWRTKPFDVVALRGQGAKTLYPNKGCAEQLAQIHNISVDLLEATIEEGVRIQKAKACLANGRCVTKTGAVTVAGKRGDDYANAVMKCETKAHRRAVLALVGLNMPDESELETIPGSQRFTMDVESGEIASQPHNAPTAQNSRSTATPAPAEVGTVDEATGQIISTAKEMGEEIKKLREVIGWTADDVRNEARRLGLDLRTKDGLLGMIATLDGHVARFMSEDDDEENYEAYEAQGTLIDAETRPIDWSER